MANDIKTVRATSRFESYEVQTPDQENALRVMRGLAVQLSQISHLFYSNESPFSGGALWVFAGRPGVGKSHLLESLVNYLQDVTPSLVSKIYLLRQPTTGALLSMEGGGGDQVDYKKIVLLDDLFANFKAIEDLKKNEIVGLMRFITYIYEQKIMCLTTSNFPFQQQLLPLIAQQDPTGRVVSRCAELLGSNAGEITIDGPDYRVILARRGLQQRSKVETPFGFLPPLKVDAEKLVPAKTGDSGSPSTQVIKIESPERGSGGSGGTKLLRFPSVA